MFQSSCDHLQGVFLKICFLKEVAKIFILVLDVAACMRLLVCLLLLCRVAEGTCS